MKERKMRRHTLRNIGKWGERRREAGLNMVLKIEGLDGKRVQSSK